MIKNKDICHRNNDQAVALRAKNFFEIFKKKCSRLSNAHMDYYNIPALLLTEEVCQ